MDLSMIASKGEPLQILIPTEFSVHASVMRFHLYRNIWQPKIVEILETRIEPENKVKYTVAVIDEESRFTGHLPKDKHGKYIKNFLFSFSFYILMG